MLKIDITCYVIYLYSRCCSKGNKDFFLHMCCPFIITLFMLSVYVQYLLCRNHTRLSSKGLFLRNFHIFFFSYFCNTSKIFLESKTSTTYFSRKIEFVRKILEIKVLIHFRVDFTQKENK